MVSDQASDEDFWRGIRGAFALDPNLINLNNGGCSPSPRVVADSLRRQIEYANQAPSFYMWRHLDPEIETVRRRLAQVFGADPEEIAITRNASESLINLIFGLPLAAGDEVLTTDQDYPRNMNALRQLERRVGVKLVQAEVPAAPQAQRELIDAFARAITPRTRMILVSQVAFLTGHVYPVAEICALGRERGIPVIVDGAHGFAHFPFTRDELGCDFYGAALHKWLMAPVGTGVLYVRKSEIGRVWPLMGADPSQDQDIRKFEEIGTHQAAIHNAIGEALAFHEVIGVERKAARLRYLRARWADQLRGHPKIRFHTNFDQSYGLCTVEIVGIEPAALGAWLETKRGIIVAPIFHPSCPGVRVTANVYTLPSEVDTFAESMLHAATHGIE